MFFKTCKSRSKFDVLSPKMGQLPNYFAADSKSLAKLAERIEIDPSNFYLQNWAVSALEKWGYNDNFDAFEQEELKKSYGTFKGSWSCFDHENHSAHLAVGTNVDAVYMPEDYVQIVMAIDRKKAESRRPRIEARIISGDVTDTSMGCIARESVCGACDNVAFDETQYCDHIRFKRGQKIVVNGVEKVAFEKNRGVVFFEDSIITDSEGADRNARILAKLASRSMVGPKSIPSDRFYKLIQGMAKSASRDERAVLNVLLENVTRILDEQ